MRRKIARTCQVAAVLLACSIAQAATPSKNTVVGGLNLNKPISVRQMGMAGIGQGSGGMLAMWSNPAFLMDMETKGELSAGGGAMNDAVESFMTLGGGWKFSDDLAAGGFLGFDGVSIDEMDGSAQMTGQKLTDNTMAIGVGGAYRRGSLTGGMNVKIVSENLMTDSNSTACGDIGVAGNWSDLSAGFSLRNLGGRLVQTKATDTGIQTYPDGVALPMEFRVGASYRLSGWNLTPAIEARKATSRDAMLGLGADWKTNSWLSIRLGINGPVGGDTTNGGSGPDYSMGLSGIFKQFIFDFAFVKGQTGLSSRVNLSYAIGERSGRQDSGSSAEPEQPREEAKQSAPLPDRPAGQKLNFAIADLRGENVSAGDAAVMADLLRNELVKTNTFTVIEKQNMDKVLAEHAFQQTGCSSEECAVKLGKLLNVQRMAVGSFGKLMDSYILSIRVVNVETGAIIYADSAEGEKVSQLRGGVKDLAQRMARQIR